MTITRFFTPFLLAAALSACGGGGTSETVYGGPDLSQATADWEAGSVDLGTQSAGSVSVFHVKLTNIGDKVGDFTQFTSLPTGVTVLGCSNVPKNGTCDVTFTFAPKAEGTTANSPVGMAARQYSPLKLSATVVSASSPSATVQLYPNKEAWEGRLTIQSTAGFPVTLLNLVVNTVAGAQNTCTLTVEGSYALPFAGSAVEFGPIWFRIPAEGVVGTQNGVTVTTFTQPSVDGKCYFVPGSSLASHQVSMYTLAAGI